MKFVCMYELHCLIECSGSLVEIRTKLGGPQLAVADSNRPISLGGMDRRRNQHEEVALAAKSLQW